MEYLCKITTDIGRQFQFFDLRFKRGSLTFIYQQKVPKELLAGMLDSTGRVVICSGEYVKIPLGFRVFCPPGWWLELRPRSSTFAKKNLHALYGVIDEDFEGQMIFAAQFIPEVAGGLTCLTIQEGEAIGQIVPIRRQEMKIERVSNEEYENFCKERNTTRGAGGFGSTG